MPPTNKAEAAQPLAHSVAQAAAAAALLQPPATGHDVQLVMEPDTVKEKSYSAQMSLLFDHEKAGGCFSQAKYEECLNMESGDNYGEPARPRRSPGGDVV